MARIKSRKSCARHFTPLLNLLYLDQRTNPKTPSRCGIKFGVVHAPISAAFFFAVEDVTRGRDTKGGLPLSFL